MKYFILLQAQQLTAGKISGIQPDDGLDDCTDRDILPIWDD